MEPISLKIIFWNIGSVRQRAEEIETILKDVDILICVETWLAPDSTFRTFPGFLTLRRDRTHARGGGILMFIRKSVAYREINNLQSPDDSVELLGVQLSHLNPPLDLIACYRTPGQSLTHIQWDLICSNVAANANCIFMRDFNAHNTNWNCNYTDSNGYRLSNSIDAHDLFLHNNNSLTHLDLYRNNRSNLDLIFSTINISDKSEPIGMCELDSQYSKFCTIEYEQLEPHSRYEFFADIVTDFIRSSTPTKKKKNIKKKTNCGQTRYSNPVFSWDSECDKIKRLRRGSFKKWEHTGNLEYLINYKKYAALAKKTFKNKKRECFRKFAESISFHTNPSYVWDKCRILKNKWVRATSSGNSENLQQGIERDQALNKISPPWVPTNPEWLPPCDQNDFLDSQFDLVEFNIALDSKNFKSASGMDGIDYEILKNLPVTDRNAPQKTPQFEELSHLKGSSEHGKTERWIRGRQATKGREVRSLRMWHARMSPEFVYLRRRFKINNIFNSMYTMNEFPLSWKKSFVHFINKIEGNGLRPISLTSCSCKLFESMIKGRMQWWAEHESLIPPSQQGFRKGRSCSDNLVNLTLKIEEAFMEKSEVLAAFLDVQGAFDNVDCNILLARLADLGSPRNLLLFIKFLTHERQIYSATSPSKPRLVFRGVPQGGVLSPLLYILYVSDTTRNIPRNVYVSQFADDIAIYVKFKIVKRAQSTLTNAINIISKNLHQIGLTLTPHKTKLIRFNNKKILPGTTQIKLWIVFDYRLLFKMHIDLVIKRCSRALNIIKYLRGTWWGSDPETLITLYKSFIRSTIDYGSFIYFPSQKYLTAKLESIQNTAIRLALGYRKTTPLNILIGESNCL
ncbi:uncharacterized protein LOC143362464 [Halictus rubicundus]|uniref:uncharacterized protein LOC143362464 n=1 Tax=Halictus rubicundus TaxID=77578 RepID=UPI0040373198